MKIYGNKFDNNTILMKTNQLRQLPKYTTHSKVIISRSDDFMYLFIPDFMVHFYLGLV